MRNCIIAQSGGPTPVINASAAGILSANKLQGFFDNVYGGINGIEGIINEKIINLTCINEAQIHNLKYTPSSALGSCRYKLSTLEKSEKEYEKIFDILDKYKIEAFFYIGGNDSMDTVSKLSQYAKAKSINKLILGIPKTIDNDLVITDHCPGFASAARLIATTVLETYLDSTVYSNNGVFILETMGRDTGWLAASGALATLNGHPAADFIYLPERTFNNKDFLEDISKAYREKKHVYILVSEGLKNSDGTYLSELSKSDSQDNFGHAQLGGVSSYLKSLIVTSGITSRVKTLELGVMQRCGMHIVSGTDIAEAFGAGEFALNCAQKGISASMIGIKRLSNSPYVSEFTLIDADNVCNRIKYFPSEWINERGNFITKEAIDYIYPLINGCNDTIKTSALPSYFVIDKNNLITA